MENAKKKKKNAINEMHAKVLVVGAGIAGTCAAVSAAEALGLREGAGKKHVSVLLASKGPVFSGSSFFQGTWGLGLIAPVDSADEEDLAQTILHVGEGVANEDLVRSFVAGIRPSIDRLKSWGVTLKQASEGAHDQREYIPCFDRKHRTWHGIERKAYVRAMSKRISAAGITVKSGWGLLDIDAEAHIATFFVREDGSAAAANPSAVFSEQSAAVARSIATTNQNTSANQTDVDAGQSVAAAHGADTPVEETCFRAVICSKVAECGKAPEPCFVQVHYDALVLCTGGASSLFTRHLTRNDCCAAVQGLAKLVGCRLTNMAFMQFMPGIISPVQGVVFNEKTFRFMTLDPRVQETLGGAQETKRLLDMRSTYGPFTCRLESCAIDFAMAQEEKRAANEEAPESVVGTTSTESAAEAQGLALLPQFESADTLPEFVQTYLIWLKNEVGVSENTPLCIGLYAHANNGGISIDQHGYTGVPGIYAAGECTGGMHGADRPGGLSSANGLVFGMRAGMYAAQFAREAEMSRTSSTTPSTSLPAWTHYASPEAAHINMELSRIMDESCMIMREKTKVECALVRIDELSTQLENSMQEIGNVTTRTTETAANVAVAETTTATPTALASAAADAAAPAAVSITPTETVKTRALTPTEAAAAAETRTVQLRLLTARAMVEDILRQPQSRGSHYWSALQKHSL